MVPAGQITDMTLHALAQAVEQGDIIIDGGNSYYKDSLRHAAELKEKNIHFIDVGTSGGVWGKDEGYSLMIGGEKKIVDSLTPIFETLAPAADKGWGHVGAAGAGHFTKMVHNGIEYGMMQAFAEGFEIMNAKKDFDLDLHQVSEIWRYGSVVRSWLLDLTAGVLEKDASLADLEAYVPDSGEGRWTVAEAIDLNVAAPIITLSLEQRIRSRQEAPYADKLLSAMRNAFGGHDVKKVE
jgi:6-phosphogluconate dehydrogenase